MNCAKLLIFMLQTKDYQLELRKFASSQHLYTGIRLTACVILPAILLYRYGLLVQMIAVPLGALFTCLADTPGPIEYRRNGMLVSVGINTLLLLIAGFSRAYPWLIGLELAGFGLFFSLIAVYGNRASSIGLGSLIVFILATGSQVAAQPPLRMALNFLAGGCWSLLFTVSLSTLRPYRLVQQQLGECLMLVSNYLSLRARFYDESVDGSAIVPEMIEQQVQIHRAQETLREMLFTTRRFVAESTVRGRILVMCFRESIDLFETIMTSQQDYSTLRSDFGDTGVLRVFENNIRLLADELYYIGLAVQEGRTYTFHEDVDAALQASGTAILAARKEHLKASRLEGFIRLRHIHNSMADLTERIKRIRLYTTYQVQLAGKFESADFKKFAGDHQVDPQLLKANLSLKSTAFRHGLRLTVALLAGHTISLFFSLGHGYWILLTIATIIKPAYGLTRERNLQRLAGTFGGAVLGFLALFLTFNSTVIFILMVAMMILAYSLLRVNYGLSMVALTVFLLLSFHFLHPQGLTLILLDRLVDTAIGSVIAFTVAYFILPAWERENIGQLMRESVDANRQYYDSIAKAFAGEPRDVQAYKAARKQAFVALANLSDKYQRMLSDPKAKQPDLPLYHQFVATSHMLTSYIASLSTYARDYAELYASSHFQPLINMTNAVFDEALRKQTGQAALPTEQWQSADVIKRVRQLLDHRKKDIEEGGNQVNAETRKLISDMTTITDQFRLIFLTVSSLAKIRRGVGV